MRNLNSGDENHIVNAHDVSEFDQVKIGMTSRIILIDYELVTFITENFGYPSKYIINELESNRNNY